MVCLIKIGFRPPKHLSTAVPQMVNFLGLCKLSGGSASVAAFLDTLYGPVWEQLLDLGFENEFKSLSQNFRENYREFAEKGFQVCFRKHWGAGHSQIGRAGGAQLVVRKNGVLTGDVLCNFLVDLGARKNSGGLKRRKNVGFLHRGEKTAPFGRGFLKTTKVGHPGGERTHVLG